MARFQSRTMDLQSVSAVALVWLIEGLQKEVMPRENKQGGGGTKSN